MQQRWLPKSVMLLGGGIALLVIILLVIVLSGKKQAAPVIPLPTQTIRKPVTAQEIQQSAKISLGASSPALLPDVFGTVSQISDKKLTITSGGKSYSYTISTTRTKFGPRPNSPADPIKQSPFQASDVKTGDHVEVIGDNSSDLALLVYSLTDDQYNRLK